MRVAAIVGVAGGLVLALCAPARAQLAGSHTLGDYGVQAGSQPGPGFYDVVFYYRGTCPGPAPRGVPRWPCRAGRPMG